LPTMRKVATFWKEDTKYSLRYFPTSGLARAFTRSASALFQVKQESSKLPETCSTNRSLLSRRAVSAASAGWPRNWTLVPYVSLLGGVLFGAGGGASAMRSRWGWGGGGGGGA